MDVYVLLMCGFALGSALSLSAAVLGWRGRATDRSVGFVVPDEVKMSPQLRRKANDLIAFWAFGAAVLALPPLIPLWSAYRSGDDDALSLVDLLVLAGYGLVLSCMAHHPFERIKRLAEEARRPAV